MRISYLVRALLCFACACAANAAAAQDCTPTYFANNTYWSYQPESLQVWGDAGRAHVFTPPVPAGQVWKMRTISLSTADSQSLEYMIEWLVAIPGTTSVSSYHEIARGWASATPALHVAPADAAAMIMQPGERLAGRVNAGSFAGFALYYSGWSFPIACVPRLLGVESVSSSGVPLPDYSAFVSALTQAATALQGVAESVP